MALVVDVTKMSEDEAMAYEQECLEREKNSKGKSSPSTDKAGAVSTGRSRKLGVDEIVSWCLDALKTTMLPIGYPKTVSDDYTEYTLWRMGQIIASQISGVLTTQALLYAVGLGKGAIPTAAAINWVLKDGIGYLSKIVLSKYGRHFDVHPKGWRLLSDLIEDGACGLELLTPTFPHLFVPLTAVAGAGKSAAGLIQAATRSCFYAGFATQNNFAEVIAKGEAQGMVSKSLGIALGIGISSKVGSSGPLLVLSFGTVTAVHVLCNLKSYQAVQLHTLNPYRTGLIMAEYLTTQRIPSVRDVNSVEPIFTVADFFSSKKAPLSISCESKCAAADIEKNLKLGVSFGEAVASRGAAQALLDLYSGEEYLLTYDDSHCFKVVLKKSASPHDMLRAVVQASYLRHIHNQQSLSKDELLKLSYQSMQQSFNELIQGLQAAGWSTSGLVARPGSNRLG
ncbi:protein root UVB sensitive 1, chloroplastic [Selaginella moellendorffii]|nr:protein root UVB sensitive 1, chloroplastic [Selaginella moellendorffii]XP_024519516.1 protein root UVB sensitive 1, chloroplastic [Selaginella moellendorffii]XP_024519517.1 protein root UVB sensitive 1, chloroplastic [Selaginella moellendorffii]XP_024519518.1 protein root UVB sensitive 1, chloroplastic [Selaginella moellendorffii]XP_024519519.1 protein root UVB sensitive 1, chloroplastic [Selaginella moellendorffii]XP_024519520.1 protein root UVB sensitive 1, chloroplastic [Selaginella moe|eukprot:XP_024519515.1 protein root UVB sensitive 1, chloroplastic [Selaginella moellendorffii]